MDKTLKYYNESELENLGLGRKYLLENGMLWGTPQARYHWQKDMMKISMQEGHVYCRKTAYSYNKISSRQVLGTSSKRAASGSSDGPVPYWV